MIDLALTVQEVCKDIGAIQQEYKEKNGKKNIRYLLDEMFTMYLGLTLSLPEDITLWTIRLCSSYFNALICMVLKTECLKLDNYVDNY